MSTESLSIAWVFSLVTALWFGWVAHRAGRNRFTSGLSGWGLGLTTATVILGLAEASFLPIAPDGYFALRLKATLMAGLLIAAVGAIFSRTCRTRS